MKKVFSLVLVALLACSVAYAVAPASDNVEIIGNNGGATGISPVTVIVPVRYGYTGGTQRTGGSLSSGDVVVWDTTSADGVTISGCITDGAPLYAGVLVTDIQTANSVSLRRGTRNWGWMAVKGHALAKIDVSLATDGKTLTTGGLDLSGSFKTIADADTVSLDIGVLIKQPSADGLGVVWLR